MLRKLFVKISDLKLYHKKKLVIRVPFWEFLVKEIYFII